MSKEDIISEITRLRKEMEALHQFLESKHKDCVNELMLVDMMRKKEVNKKHHLCFFMQNYIP